MTEAAAGSCPASRKQKNRRKEMRKRVPINHNSNNKMQVRATHFLAV